jgi:hypothetical protein
MPCAVGCLALFFPRLAIVLVWLASDYLEQAYLTLLWPLLGFLFMPLTTLAYAFAWHEGGGSISGSKLGLLVFVLAILMDLGILGGGASRREVRRYVVTRRTTDSQPYT